MIEGPEKILHGGSGFVEIRIKQNGEYYEGNDYVISQSEFVVYGFHFGFEKHFERFERFIRDEMNGYILVVVRLLAQARFRLYEIGFFVEGNERELYQESRF